MSRLPLRVLLLVLAGCGGGSGDAAQDDASSSPQDSGSAESPGGPTSSDSQSDSGSESAATLPGSGLCDLAARHLRTVTGDAKAVDLAPGDPYSGGLGEAPRGRSG